MSGGTIGLTELLVGVPFPVTPLEIMRFAVGPAVAGLALTGRTVGPDEASRMGLVDTVVEPGELLPDAVRRAAALGCGLCLDQGAAAPFHPAADRGIATGRGPSGRRPVGERRSTRCGRPVPRSARTAAGAAT